MIVRALLVDKTSLPVLSGVLAGYDAGAERADAHLFPDAIDVPNSLLRVNAPRRRRVDGIATPMTVRELGGQPSLDRLTPVGWKAAQVGHAAKPKAGASEAVCPSRAA